MLLMTVGCKRQSGPTTTPWGTVLGDTTEVGEGKFSLADIVRNGELIIVTLSGPETYYDYRGHGMGTHYLLCENFAQQIGVSLRVEVCKDTMEMVGRLERGEADIIVFPLPRDVKDNEKLLFCGAVDSLRQGKVASKADTLRVRQWAVMEDNQELADTLNRWFKPDIIAKIEREQDFLLSSRSIKRHVYSPMLNRSQGLISRYDDLFKKYAPTARIDWRLMAAQCYQESCFDPNARSWAGACGLMQIMPSTARHLGLPSSQMYEPEANVSAAARLLAELIEQFSDVQNAEERMNFVLASYNAGSGHVRDAMALADKHGAHKQRWGEVAQYVLRLREPEYYRDPVVKHGYMRGTETVDYVSRIRSRYAQYCGSIAGHGSYGAYGGSGNATPHRAKKKNKFKI